MSNKRFCLAISGASGFQYGLRLMDVLLSQGHTVYLLLSDAAREVARIECSLDIAIPPDDQHRFFEQYFERCLPTLHCFEKHDWLAPVASGSANLDAMIICPCSTGTLASIASGLCASLTQRAASVCLKEGHPLIVVPRETPMSTIHLQHMASLSAMGVCVLPAAPGFYYQPTTVGELVDFVVGKVLRQLKLDQQLLKAWGQQG